MKSLLLSVLWLSAAALSTAAADTLRGREVFIAECTRCHSLDPEELGKRGPHLAGLFARRYGAVEGFPYRMVWTEADPVWTEGQLDAYLEIHRLPEPEARAEVIEFLVAATDGARPADAARGEGLYNTECSYCHALTEEGARTVQRLNGDVEEITRALEPPELEADEPARPTPPFKTFRRRGPHLAQLLERSPGAVPDFPYRFVYRIPGPRWTEADLDSYIAFHARMESFDRADLIAFLKRATP